MLKAQNISLSLQGRLLLDDISANFVAGKVNVILGPNGAGKSTLLACLSGLRPPDSGSAILSGRDIAILDARERARHIGFLPQSAEVHWDILAHDLIALGRYPHHGRAGKAEDEAAIKAAMERADVMQFARRNVLKLSGGERARVLLARVLATQTGWLLADEPLANLDPRHQLQLLRQLRDLADEGTGVIAVLHDLTHAARFADHILLLNEGRLFAQGAPEEVMTKENLRAVYGIEAEILRDTAGQLAIIANA